MGTGGGLGAFRRPGNLATLSTLARAQTLAGQAAENEATLLRAVDHPTADILQVHQLGATLSRLTENTHSAKRA